MDPVGRGRGLTKLPFELGVGHYDDPPPDTIDGLAGLEQLHAAGAFRFANHLRAWVEVTDGRIVDHGHAGRGYISSTLLAVGPLHLRFQPTAFPELRTVPEVSDTAVRFVQTTGGRPGVPARDWSAAGRACSCRDPSCGRRWR